MDSDSDDCQLYTRTAKNIAMKKKLLDEDRYELALRMKYLPDDQIQGYSEVFEQLNDSPEPPAGSETLSPSKPPFDSETLSPSKPPNDSEVLGLNVSGDERQLRRSTRNKRKAANLPVLKKKNTKKSKNKASNNTACSSSGATASNNTNAIPTIILDDDIGIPTSFAPIQFNSRSKKDYTEEDDIISLEKLQADYVDENDDEDLDTLVKISVDWTNSSQNTGFVTKFFQLRRYQKFETIFEELSKMEGVPVNRIVIMRNFETIRPRDTPASLKLTYYGRLLGRVSKTEVDHTLPKVSDFNDDDDCKKLPEQKDLQVKLLLDNKKSLSLTISKTQKMNVLYKKCAEELKVPDSNIKISFDGEVVQQQDTVSDLGVEDGDVFDVLIKKE